jgi:hypothetical protein
VYSSLASGRKLGKQRAHSRNDDPLDVQIRLETKDEECEYLNCNLFYDKFRGLRTGVRNISVTFQDGSWSYQVLESDKLRVLSDYLQLHPGETNSRKIAKALPELGSHPNVFNLLKKLDKQKESRTEKR